MNRYPHAASLTAGDQVEVVRYRIGFDTFGNKLAYFQFSNGEKSSMPASRFFRDFQLLDNPAPFMLGDVR